jgi:serine/threonine protein kinase
MNVTGIEVGSRLLCPTCQCEIDASWKLGRYILERHIGGGGMGTIYEAKDTHTERTVAVKVLKEALASNDQFLKDFAREAQLTASISHPNVVEVYEFGEDQGMYYLAMELIPGGSLDDMMQKAGRLDEISVLDIGIQAARGLEEALQRGLIHRDVKPGNILFGPGNIAKLVDFGLSIPLNEASLAQGEVWGTPFYVAPEKLEQLPEDHRSDIYSLGATLFHAIAGRPPHDDTTASLVAWKHLKTERVPLKTFAPHVTKETAAAINRCIEREPGARFQSYAELIASLEYAKKMAIQRAAAPAPTPQSLDLTGSAAESALSFRITIGALILAIVLGSLLFILRDRIFNREASLAPAAVAERLA